MSEEGALEKSGAELFRELLRVYPVAEVDDYFKAGMWKDDQMKVDLQLIEAHRREAGAPDPVALDEVEMPPLPKVLSLPGAVRPPGVGITLPVRPVTATATPVAAKLAGVVTPAAGGGPMAELRLIALFVAKWKLDAAKTKTMLAKLTPQRRRYVIQNFKAAEGAEDPTASLEQYIAECEKTDAWAAPAAVAATVAPKAATVIAPTVVAGVKRPLMPAAVLDPSKRPRIMPNPAATLAPKAAAVVAPKMQPTGAVRPAVIRPVTVAATVRPGVSPVRPAAVRPAVVPGIRPVGIVKPAGQQVIKPLVQRF